jgi:hypothetical protein
MGGSGSGRPRLYAETTTNDLHSIDLAMMRRRGWDKHGSGTLSWSRNGHKTGSIAYEMLPGGMRLSYTSRGESISELVPFAYSATQFGGMRKWFLCLSCGRRYRVIYGGKFFRCRKCHGAHYPSQYQRAFMRYGNREQDIRERMGGSRCVDDPFPVKPKWMRWPVYAKLYREDQRWVETWQQTYGVTRAILRDKSPVTPDLIREAKQHSRFYSRL